MANTNDNLCADFAQSKFNLELSNFLEHIKQTYPNERERVCDLAFKLLKFDCKCRELISIDDLDNLGENLAKAKALSVAALSNDDFADLDAETINNYLWTLEDLLTNAQNIIAQNDNS